MNEYGAIQSVHLDANVTSIDRLGLDIANIAEPTNNQSFQSIISNGLKNMDSKINTANEMVQEFAVDNSVPLHQVTMALEEARLSVEMAMQVRARLIEGYREIMNMQL